MTQPTTRERPLGITILAVLAAIGGVVNILGSLGATALGGVTGVGGFGLLGVIGLVVGVASLAFAYGAWTLQAWGWTLGVAVAAGGILYSLYRFIQPGGNIVGLLIGVAISGVILYYLYQPDVKAAFGRT